MYLLYPSNPLRLRQPDEQFAAEADAVRAAGFEVSLFSMEGFQGGEFRPVPPLPSATDVLYRGWMLSASEYEALISALSLAEPEHVSAVVADMQRFRGVIEGGFCVRRVESFLPETECRYFVVDGVPHTAADAMPMIVHECASRLHSRFYSVDVVKRTDGELRIVEVGDGQVSDLVGWTPEQFAAVLAEHFLR